MSDLFDKVTEDQDPFKKIASKIPGFSGYIERQNRRAADKMLREMIAEQYLGLWKRIGELQQDMVSSGELSHLDDLEKAATKVQTFIDKIQNASYGYSSFFDAEKINEDELSKLYDFDASLLDMVDGLTAAIDNVGTSVGSDGLPAAISHLVTMSRDLVSTFENRDEAVTGIS